jgi:glycosyltransferase involved in cell wall biosynthesis
LITYYWPPSGGAGVHRWLRFSKYFKQNNCNLTVYCPKEAAWPVIDNALSNEVSGDINVIRRKIFEPHKYLGKGGTGVGFTEQKKQGLIKKMMVWTRGNLFIPDSRVFWIKPSVRFLSSYLKEHPEIDTIISTGPPHSTHLIAHALQKKFDIKWVADFRDPWTQIDFYEQLLPGKKADAKHKRLEQMCLEDADRVITVSQSCAEGLEEIGKRKVYVVTNGYEFPDFDARDIKLDKAFTISHFGSMPFARNPLVLWKGLEKLLKEIPALKDHLEIQLVGTVDHNVISSAEKHGLGDFIRLTPPVSHSESIDMQRSSQLLLLVANNTGNVKGILTGKFFEYLGAKRPIIGVGLKDSDLNNAMTDTDSGFFADYDDVEGVSNYLKSSFESFQNDKLHSTAKNLGQFHSQELAKKFIELIP